jgi:hypothetical protein
MSHPLRIFERVINPDITRTGVQRAGIRFYACAEQPFVLGYTHSEHAFTKGDTMAAVAPNRQYQPLRQSQARPNLRLVWSQPDVHRHAPGVYRRRRVVASILVIATLALVFAGVSWMRSGESAAAGSEVEGPATVEWQVGPGDTLWSIASEVKPGEDVRPMVEALSRSHGSDLDVGDVVTVPLD